METGLAVFVAIAAFVIYLMTGEKWKPEISGRSSMFGRVEFPPNIERWRSAAARASQATGIDSDIILAIVWTESSGNPHAQHGLDEVGLMGMRPIAARDVGYATTPTDPAEQVLAGAKFLKLQISRMGGDLYDGLRAYNAGAGAAQRNPNISTDYAERVLTRAGRLS